MDWRERVSTGRRIEGLLKEKKALEKMILDQERARITSILPRNYTDGNDDRRSLFERRTKRISAAQSVWNLRRKITNEVWWNC